jgi:uncharacterized protein (TIGR00661 family)
MAAVADVLRQNGVACVFSTYGPAADYIRRAGYEVHESPPLMWQECPDGSVDLVGSVARIGPYLRTFAAHVEDERRRLSRIRPHAILVDSRYSTIFATTRGDAPNFFLSNQLKFLMPRWHDHYLMRWAGRRISHANYHWLRRTEAIFFPDFPPPDTISRENAVAPENIMRKVDFVGPVCRARPGDVKDADAACRAMGFDGGIFAYAAVSGPGRTRAFMIDILRKILPRFEGKSIIVKGDVTDLSSEWVGGKVNVRGWTDKRFELLKSSSIVISRPGLTTLSEIVGFGKKSVLVPIPTQSEQEGNARSMVGHGAARVIEQSAFNPDSLAEALEKLARNSAEYDRNAARLKHLAERNDGARRIAERILEHVER